MPYVEPTTRATGHLVTAADWNQDVVANISFLANPPACRVYNSTNQATSGTSAALTFNSERFDTDSMHSTSSNTSRITFNTAGLYVVSFTCAWGNSATGGRELSIALNGTTSIAMDEASAAGMVGSEFSQSLTTMYKFAANDYVEVLARQSSGGSLDIVVAGNRSPEFSAVWVGRG